MTQNSEMQRGWCLIVGLPQNDEEQRVSDFRSSIRDSIGNDWMRDAVVQAYQLAGSGEWDVNSICDTQMLLTAIDENPSLFPVVEPEIERMVERFQQAGIKFRSTWDCVRDRLRSNGSAIRMGPAGAARAKNSGA